MMALTMFYGFRNQHGSIFRRRLMLMLIAWELRESYERMEKEQQATKADRNFVFGRFNAAANSLFLLHVTSAMSDC